MAEEPALLEDVAVQINQSVKASPAPEQSSPAASIPPTRANQIDVSSAPAFGLPASNGGLLSASGAVAELGAVNPSACGCGGKSGPPQLVYALGTVGYDFGSEARRDWFTTAMKGIGQVVPPTDPPTYYDLSPYNPRDLETFFQGQANAPPGSAPQAGHPEAAEALIWTLNIDATPIYAVQPKGPYAVATYAKLREFLAEQQTALQGGQDAERASVPGYITGQVRLLSGQTVPAIQPDLRGMFNWTTKDLAAALAKALDLEGEKHKAELIAELNSFLDRIYYECRNLGVTSQDRALNYAGTVALLVATSLEDESKKGYRLDTIAVDRSAVCRPESDCWDVKLTFFNPKKQFEESRRVHFFPIDVSDVIPVALAKRTVFSVR
jgi:cyanobactin maturation PatA/PatG family protease